MLLMIAASAHEFAGFSGLRRQRSRAVRWLALGTVGGADALLVANGYGYRAASRGARTILGAWPVQAVVSTGFAGALDPSLEIGEILVADRILSGHASYPALLPPIRPSEARCGTLLTVNEVVGSAREKRELSVRWAAHAIDMEAAAVAAVTTELGLAFYCVRSISDRASDDFPVDFNRAIRQDGTLSNWSLAVQLNWDIRRWTRLLHVVRDGRTAAKSLASCLSNCEFPT